MYLFFALQSITNVSFVWFLSRRVFTRSFVLAALLLVFVQFKVAHSVLSQHSPLDVKASLYRACVDEILLESSSKKLSVFNDTIFFIFVFFNDLHCCCKCSQKYLTTTFSDVCPSVKPLSQRTIKMFSYICHLYTQCNCNGKFY